MKMRPWREKEEGKQEEEGGRGGGGRKREEGEVGVLHYPPGGPGPNGWEHGGGEAQRDDQRHRLDTCRYIQGGEG